ncbi:MAG: N-acetylmuramoyl-L-alanine amidase [candidate division Zixibacteria bacterium]|nr:N-acetylmuramoyl-L-alanine amidase [candidate division Zixibacteria bacterium]
MKNQYSVPIVCIFLLGLLLVLSSSASSSVFVTEDGKAHYVKTTQINGLEYISANELSSILNAEVYWHTLLRKVVLELDDRQMVFTWFSPYMLYDSEVYNLSYDVKPKDGTLYIPLKSFQKIWHRIKDFPLAYTLGFVPSERPTGAQFNIIDLDVTEKVNGILVEIFISQPVEYEIFADQNRGLNINFYQGRLDTLYFNKKKTPKFLRWIKAYQFENSAQLSLRLRKPFVNFTHNLKTNPFRIQISLIHTPSSNDTTKLPLSHIFGENERLTDELIDVIVIDPGHGGQDSGAVGKAGLMEKEVTLDIAKRLRNLLKKEKGLRVILTRETDVLVPLEERTQIANRNGADLFISIHTNAFKKRSVRGCQTFFLASAKSDEARAVAALENSSIRFEHPEESSQNLDDLDFILMDLVQSEYLKESSYLATIIQKQMKKKLSIPSRGVSQAGFVVLNKAYMPAVLVETAFISNKREEALLKKGTFRQKIAQALCQSIKEFKKKYESAK